MNLIYAGIGSRSTPEPVLETMRNLAAVLARQDYMLRSGGAQGADKAFEAGCDAAGGSKRIFKSADARGWAYEEADRHIPANRPPFEHWKPYVRGLIARNMMQILGRNGDQPASFVLCWTQADVADGGGTGYAIRCARAHHVPVYNMNHPEVMMRLAEWVVNRDVNIERAFDGQRQNST